MNDKLAEQIAQVLRQTGHTVMVDSDNTEVWAPNGFTIAFDEDPAVALCSALCVVFAGMHEDLQNLQGEVSRLQEALRERGAP